MDTEIHCSRCNAVCKPEGCTTGYGVDREGNKMCFACCADMDRADMIATGKAVLYLTNETDWRLGSRFGNGKVGNWPGSLTFPCGTKRNAHGGGFGAQRTDAWFRGPDGCDWWGVNRGDSQIIVCKRLKARKLARKEG